MHIHTFGKTVCTADLGLRDGGGHGHERGVQTTARDARPPAGSCCPSPLRDMPPHPAPTKPRFSLTLKLFATKEAEAPHLHPGAGAPGGLRWAGLSAIRASLGAQGTSPLLQGYSPCQTPTHRPAEGTEAVNTPAAKSRGRRRPQVPGARCPRQPPAGVQQGLPCLSLQQAQSHAPLAAGSWSLASKGSKEENSS